MPTEVADGVFQLAPLPYVNVVALRGDDGWTIVDAALSVLGGRLTSMLRSIGVRTGDVEQLVLTHGHVDHAGAAEQLRGAFGARRVLAGAADVPAIRDGRNASGATPSFVARLGRLDPGYPAVPSVEPLDGELAIGDGRTLVPVPTPGHTDGHLSFHLPALDLVIGGDTVFNVFRMTPSPGFLCSDAPRNRTSILSLADLAPSTLLLAHGTPVTGDVAGRLRTMAA